MHIPTAQHRRSRKVSHQTLTELVFNDRFYTDIVPDLVLPFQVERAYNSLTNVTATHATLSAFETLANIVHPLLLRNNYPAGAGSLLDLMVRLSHTHTTHNTHTTHTLHTLAHLPPLTPLSLRRFPALIRTTPPRRTRRSSSTLRC